MLTLVTRDTIQELYPPRYCCSNTSERGTVVALRWPSRSVVALVSVALPRRNGPGERGTGGGREHVVCVKRGETSDGKWVKCRSSLAYPAAPPPWLALLPLLLLLVEANTLLHRPPSHTDPPSFSGSVPLCM